MNPLLGILFHWAGGFASGSFYVPFRGVRRWSWETYWLVSGVLAWLIMPWLLALIMTEDLRNVLLAQSADTLFWTWCFGALWGLGGLTFGLTMRYLGLSLGMGLALGYTAAFGTLIPPIAKSLVPSLPVNPSFGEILATTSGQVTLFGIAVCLIGIYIVAIAGLTKEREMPEEAKQESIREFNYRRGVFVATFSGIMSACFAFGLTAGSPIGEASSAAGTELIWTGLPKLVVVLLGGFTTNFVWCAILHFRNKSASEYLGTLLPAECADAEISGGGQRIVRNYAFSALAGITWYMQFFFYTMGESQMGRYGFASWTLHMASIIIFSNLWGWFFDEWKGASTKARGLVVFGIATLVVSTIIIGGGAWLQATR